MEYKERIARTISCHDCDDIPKVTEAGMVIDGNPPMQIMHNGTKIIKGAYHGDWMTEIIKTLGGHHEPQEEKTFYEVLQTLPEVATMIELGSFWAYYSMWFQKSIKNPTNYLIEPNPLKIEVGKEHFSLNKMAGHFVNAFVGKDSSNKAIFTDWDNAQYQIPRIALDDFMEKNNIPFLHIVHADIQGAEYEMLLGCQRSIAQNKIAFFFISTHENTHPQCINFLIEHDFEIIASHTIAESVSADGLIVAKAKWYPGPGQIKISTGEYYSQIEQDKILDQELFKRKENGFFIDVGATDGYHFSNTLFFEKWRAWRGICIEPNPIEFKKLTNSGRTCIKENYAISSKVGETDFLAIDGYGKGLSGIISLYDPRHLERIEQELKGRDSTKHVYKVKTVPLQILLDRHHIKYVDYCSIDVEGAEMEVLESIDYDKTYIKCFTIENNYGLERETTFLAGKGYRLWKRVGCDDFFVKTTDLRAHHIPGSQTTASGKLASQELIKQKINMHYASFLPFREQMAIETFDPLDILDYTRFDVPAKVIYARHRNWGVKSNWPLKIYDEHMHAFNGYDERDGSGKKGLKMFINTFDDIIDSIQSRGFDADTSLIPLSERCGLLEGAHRIAACLVSDKDITAVKFDFKPWIYDYRFFHSRGLSTETADAIALEYCGLKKNTRLVFLFPSAVGEDNEVAQILLKYSDIVYEKNLFLKNDGSLLLMRQIYRDETWLGNYRTNFDGARLKARECFKSPGPLRLFVVETDRPEALHQAKEEIRNVYNIQNHSVHINDTHEETLRLAQLLLNSNGIHFLNNAKINQFLQFENNLKFYKNALSDHKEEWFCVAGSAVMAVYGLRDARDIDYLHFRNQLGDDENGLVNSHNKEAKYYQLPIEDIIFDPKNHFYYDHIKFASLDVIYEMKRNRGEQKDRHDLWLMDSCLKPEISIIILNANGFQHIKTCIESIEGNTKEPYELIVVDNASTDGSLEYLRGIRNTLLIENKENIGCPPARALALPSAKGKYVVLLDNDTIVTDGWTAKFKAHLEKHPDIGVLGPRSNYVSGPQVIQDLDYSDLPSLEAFARKWAKDHENELLTAHRLVGFCMFISRSVIEKIGNIDASFGKFGFEDDDYTWRTIIAGFKTAIANDIFIHHTGGPQGKGDSSYNQLLLDAWDVFKKKWRLPKSLEYGQPFDLKSVLEQPFDKKKHYVPLMDPCSTEGLVYSRRSPQEGTGGSVNAENSLDSQFRQENAIKGMTSIIIYTQNMLDRTKRCVKSIRKHTPELHEIIFVDDASTDRTAKWLQYQIKENKNYRLIENKVNVGSAKACNQAINMSQGEFILLIDNDVVVNNGWLTAMLECINRAPDVGIVGPMTNNITGPQRVVVDEYRSMDYLDKYATRFKEKYRYRLISCRTIAGFCMLFKRSLVEKIGLFDERFDTGHFGDEDFCLRASLEDYQNYIAGDVFIHHFGDKGSPGDRTIIEEKWTLNAQSPLGKKLVALKSTELADNLHQIGKIDQAVEVLINCIKRTPDTNQIYYEMARIFIESKRFSEALEVVESMPEGTKTALKGLEYASYAKEGLGLDNEAAVYADRLLSLNENYPAALNLKGVLAHKNGEEEKAADYFSKAIDSDPGYGEAYTNLGVLDWGTDKKVEALALLRKGFVLSPRVPDTSMLYYSAVSSFGSYPDAEADFLDAKALYPNNKSLTFLYIDTLIQQGKFTVAMVEIEDAIAIFGIDEGILKAALAVRQQFGPLQIKETSKRSTLSLSMIVKNEEQHLVKCLKSVRDVVDEMIVVDTGSTDKTIDVARAFGANVFELPWTGDFSAARNYSLAQATGDWILILDADEVISVLDHKRLLKTINGVNGAPVAFDMVTRNYLEKSGSAGWTENEGTYPQEEKGIGWFGSNKVRLFRNNNIARFENPVHELVEASLSKAGIPIEICTIPIHHYGRLDHNKLLAKGRDYYLLGKRKLEERGGGDYVALRELAVQAGELGMSDEAADLWQQALVLRPDDVDALFNLAYQYMQIGKFQEALQAAKRSVELSPGTKNALLNYALCEMLMGNALKATALLEESASNENENPSLMAVLGTSYFINGDNDKGFSVFDKLKTRQINSVAYVNDLLKKLILSGQVEYATLLIDAAISGNIANRETLFIRDSARS